MEGGTVYGRSMVKRGQWCIEKKNIESKCEAPIQSSRLEMK